MDSKTLQALGIVLNKNILDTYLQCKHNQRIEQLERESKMNIHTSALINLTKYLLIRKPFSDYYNDGSIYSYITLWKELTYERWGHEEEVLDRYHDVPYWFHQSEIEPHIYIKYFTSRGYCVITEKTYKRRDGSVYYAQPWVQLSEVQGNSEESDGTCPGDIVTYTVAKSIQESPYKYILNDNGELNEVVYREYRDYDGYVNVYMTGDTVDKSTRCNIEYFPAQEQL